MTAAQRDDDRMVERFTRRETPAQRRARIRRIKLAEARLRVLRRALGLK
jgi:hypothetical protein